MKVIYTQSCYKVLYQYCIVSIFLLLIFTKPLWVKSIFNIVTQSLLQLITVKNVKSFSDYFMINKYR